MGKKISPDRLEIPHAINCELPNKRCGSLIGRKGETVMNVERQTGTKIDFNEAPTGQEYRVVAITGPLLSCYAAHLMLMKEYHDAEQKEEEEERRAAAASGGGSTEDKVAELQNQLAALQRQLDAQKTGGGGGGGGNRNSSKGKGKRR